MKRHERLLLAIRRSGKTQRHVARLARITETDLSRIVHGKLLADPDQLVRLKRILEMEP